MPVPARLLRSVTVAALALAAALGAARAEDGPDLIFKKSTVWNVLTPDDMDLVFDVARRAGRNPCRNPGGIPCAALGRSGAQGG